MTPTNTIIPERIVSVFLSNDRLGLRGGAGGTEGECGTLRGVKLDPIRIKSIGNGRALQGDLIQKSYVLFADLLQRTLYLLWCCKYQGLPVH